jgi:hypothetical protein
MTSPELVALVQRDREREIRQDSLARFASCVRACCNPSLIDRLARALRGTPADC